MALGSHSVILLYLFVLVVEMVRTDIRLNQGFLGHRRYVIESRHDAPNGNSVKGDEQAWGFSHNNTVTNITVQLGVTGYLHCHIYSLEDNVRYVSWVRLRDLHILSSGLFTYTNDERFQIIHSDTSQDWILKIRYVQKRDTGTYECQVSTGTGLISHLVNLKVVVPEAFIQGTPERHVDVGSVISLVCVIQKSPDPPQYVFWYHNDRMINYDTVRGGVSVETLPGTETQSRLTIRDTRNGDSGNYTCSASNTEASSIYIFVEEGDKMASLRRHSSADQLLSVWTLPTTIFSILLFFVDLVYFLN